MPDRPRPKFRIIRPNDKPLPPEHRTAAESLSFQEMLKDALEG